MLPRQILFASALLILGLAAAARAQATLSWKHPPGTRAVRTVIGLKQTLTVGGMALNTSVQSTIDSTSTTAEPGPDGAVRVTEKIDALAAKLTLGGASLDYDSRKPDAAKPDNPILQGVVDVYRVLVGSATTTVYKDGRAAGVEGTEKIRAALPPGSERYIGKSLDGAHLTKEANRELDRLPGKPVSVGDRWTRTEPMEVGGGQVLTFETHYEYLGTVEKEGRTLHRVGIFIGSVTLSIEPGSPLAAQVTASDLKIEASSGSFLFDAEAGAVVERTSSTRITGSLTLSINNMERPATLDLLIDQQRTTK